MNYITDDHIDKIVNAYIKRKDIDKYCHKAYMDEIEENDYNLNIPRYVDTFEEEEPVDIARVKNDLKEHMKVAEKLDIEIEEFFNELGL